MLNFFSKDYNVIIKILVFIKEYVNRIFKWEKDGCWSENFYLVKKWFVLKFLYVI